MNLHNFKNHLIKFEFLSFFIVSCRKNEPQWYNSDARQEERIGDG